MCDLIHTGVVTRIVDALHRVLYIVLYRVLVEGGIGDTSIKINNQ